MGGADGGVGGTEEHVMGVLAARLAESRRPRQYGRTGLTYCTVVGCSGQEQSHMQKEAGRGQGYYLRGAR